MLSPTASELEPETSGGRTLEIGSGHGPMTLVSLTPSAAMCYRQNQ